MPAGAPRHRRRHRCCWLPSILSGLAFPPVPPGLQVVILVCVHRFLMLVPPAPMAGLVHLCVYGTACAACMGWCWVAGVGPRSSYLRYMEAASMTFRLGCYGFGAAWHLQR